MSSAHEIRHEQQRSIDNADEVEVQAIREGSAVFVEGVQDEQISGELDDLEVDGQDKEAWNKQDNALDDEAGAIRDELIRRKEQIGDAYPFEVEDKKLVYLGSKTGVYEYCLGICSAPSITKRPYVKLPRSFERVVPILLEAYLGSDAQSFHLGAPRYRLGGSTFEKAIRVLSTSCSSGREWRYDPEPDYRRTIPSLGDEGVDFIVWRPSPDNRPGVVYIAGQCACGNDWSNKFHDLNVERLRSWLRPVSYVPPTRAFSTCFIMSEGNLITAQRDAGWVLDRLRLSAIAEANFENAKIVALKDYLASMFELSRKAA